MLVPIWMGTNMAAGNQQKHLSLSFATKGKFISRVTQKQYSTTFSNARTVQIAKLPERILGISLFLTSSAVM